MKKMSAKLPHRIPLNTIDRGYLLPESDVPNSTYFPMCIAACAALNLQSDRAAVVNALRHINDKYPQMRLGYRLDLVRLNWIQLPQAVLTQHFDKVVQIDAKETDVNVFIGNSIATNNVPLEQPFTVWLHGQYLIVKMHHSFGDGKFLLKLLALIILALKDPHAFEQQPALSANFSLATWRLVAQTPKQATSTIASAVSALTFGWKQKPQRAEQPRRPAGLTAVVSGTPMHVMLRTIPPSTVTVLNDLRRSLLSDQHISLNTLLQVILARRLAELGLLTTPVTYSIPIDLHRYLNDPAAFYPCNLASQIRVTVSEDFDNLARHCAVFQEDANRQFESSRPLVNLLSEWLFQRSTRKTYERLNREWLTASINTDPRLFVLTNLGNLDALYAPCIESLDVIKGVHLIVPLMGAPSLVVGFNTLREQGNLSITYDPRVLTEDQINAIFEIFEEAALRSLLQMEVSAL